MKTTKPCPGCKEVHGGRGADEVCDECQRKIKFFDQFAVEQTGELKRKEVTSVRIPGAPHWLPYLPHSTQPDAIFGKNERLGDRFQTVFLELALGLSEPSDVGKHDALGIATYTITESPGGGGEGPRLMQPGVARCLREIYDLTRSISENAFALGHSAGLKLLDKIRSGEISVNDAEVEAAKVTQRALQQKKRRRR